MANQHTPIYDKGKKIVGWKGTAKAPNTPQDDDFTTWYKNKYKTPPGIADRGKKYKEFEEDRKKQGGWGNTTP